MSCSAQALRPVVASAAGICASVVRARVRARACSPSAVILLARPMQLFRCTCLAWRPMTDLQHLWICMAARVPDLGSSWRSPLRVKHEARRSDSWCVRGWFALFRPRGRVSVQAVARVVVTASTSALPVLRRIVPARFTSTLSPRVMCSNHRPGVLSPRSVFSRLAGA